MKSSDATLGNSIDPDGLPPIPRGLDCRQGEVAEYSANQMRAYARAALAQANLNDIELYRIQMSAISTASLGYWTEAESIMPEYDTVPLRDVAKLYAKYAALYELTASATKSPDSNIEKNRELLLQRSIVGLAKYGVTTADSPISHKEWLQHALEESLDMANYLQAAINRPEPDVARIRNAALGRAAEICDAKFIERSCTGHTREASTARALCDEILAMMSKE